MAATLSRKISDDAFNLMCGYINSTSPGSLDSFATVLKADRLALARLISAGWCRVVTFSMDCVQVERLDRKEA